MERLSLRGSPGNKETDTTLDLEGFRNPVAKEYDEFPTSYAKADVDEESIEGTSELGDAVVSPCTPFKTEPDIRNPSV